MLGLSVPRLITLRVAGYSMQAGSGSGQANAFPSSGSARKSRPSGNGL